VFVKDNNDVLIVCAAFHRAWLTLLLDGKITTESLEEIPSLLLGAILDVTLSENFRDPKVLAEAALLRLAQYEKDFQAEPTVN
jgi:hypothetical protein